MGKLHELLAVEETVVSASEKLLKETAEKFNKHTEFFTGHLRTLQRVGGEPEDRAIEEAARKEKALPTDVPDTVSYILPFIEKAWDLKLSKHLTNQKAVGDIIVDEQVIVAGVPVDFLLDLEKALPRLRDMFLSMPTLDPSRDWIAERKGVYKAATAVATSQTEKRLYAVVLAEATDKHPAQVKEASKDVVVGTFRQTDFSGAATAQQKADVLALCDKLITAVKQARMRANTVELVKGEAARGITALFTKVFN